jgi:protein PhnA
MSTIPACPSCTKENTYQDGDLYICADCFHEWSVNGSGIGEPGETGDGIVRDVNGNPLADGDSVILIKDLKVKGSSTVLK